MVSWRRGGASIISSVNILFLWLLVLTFLAALEGIICCFFVVRPSAVEAMMTTSPVV